MQQVKKIIPEVKINPKHKKYINFWHNEVDKYDWDNMNEQQFRKASIIVGFAYNKTLPIGKRIFVYFLSIVLLVGFFGIVLLMVFARTDIGWYPYDWDYIFSFHVYLKHHGGVLIGALFWLFVICLSLLWLFTDRFYRREQKNMQDYIDNMRRAKGFK